MEAINFKPLEETLNKIAMYLIGLVLACIVGFLIVYFVARLIKIPKLISKYLGIIAVLAVAYLAFTQGFIPDRL